jgi:uncharacterized membrane protein
MKQLRTALVTGILVLVPMMATIDIILWFMQAVENSARHFLPTWVLLFDFKGLGILLAFAFILIAGMFTQNYVGKWVVSLFDTGIRKISIVGGIYGGIKKFLETIFNPRSDQFKGVVLVEFPRQGIYSIGFRTGNPDLKLSQRVPRKLVNVFIPCTPNPTSGFYLLVSESEVIPLELTVQEAFKIVISMGIVHSDEIEGLKP